MALRELQIPQEISSHGWTEELSKAQRDYRLIVPAGTTLVYADTRTALTSFSAAGTISFTSIGPALSWSGEGHFELSAPVGSGCLLRLGAITASSSILSFYSSSGGQYQLKITINASGYYEIRNSSGTLLATSSNLAAIGDGLVLYVTSATTATLFTPTEQFSVTVAGAGNIYRIGRTNSALSASKTIAFAAFLPAITPVEAALLAQTPLEVFAPRPIWVPVSAGGGGTSISGALGTAVASGFTGTVNANRSIAGALGTATASGFTGTVSNSTNTAITGAPGVAAASGFKGTVGANRGIAGALGVAVASGFTGAVTNDNSTTIAGALGTATASGFTGAITWNRYISGLLGVAQASGFAGGVQNGAAPVIATGGGIYPTPRRKTKQEIDEDRKRLGILPDESEVQTGIVEVPKRPTITLAQLIGKPAADTHRADMERASAAHKLRKRRQDDDLLMMM